MPEASWAPSCGLEQLRERAKLYSRIRQFFDRHDVLEVTTPLLTREGALDVYIESFQTWLTDTPESTAYYLQTSPEYSMKRLLVAEAGPIYQIATCFRRAESGRRHNPEFMMLEWYRPGFSLQQLIDEVVDLLAVCLKSSFAVRKLSYAELFSQFVGVNPHLVGPGELCAAADRLGLIDAQRLCGTDHSLWLDYLFSEVVQPQMEPDTIYCVQDYPPCQAMLARINPAVPSVAERFEIFMNGLELANGFHELGDSSEQRQRFEDDQAKREALGLPRVPLPERLLRALEQGLPDTCGVALGLDRLLMLICGKQHIDEVLSFPFDRA